MKTILATITIGLMLIGANPAALAADDHFGLSPSACQNAVASFMTTRLEDPRSARVKLDSDPYQVSVSMRGGRTASVWAVDVLVKSRLPSGSWSNYQPYTVVFQNGAAVGLESDFSGLTRV